MDTGFVAILYIYLQQIIRQSIDDYRLAIHHYQLIDIWSSSKQHALNKYPFQIGESSTKPQYNYHLRSIGNLTLSSYLETKIQCHWQTAYTQLLSFPRTRESIFGAITMFTKSQNWIGSIYIILLPIIPQTIHIIPLFQVFPSQNSGVPNQKLRDRKSVV